MEHFEKSATKEAREPSINHEFSPSDFTTVNKMNGNDAQPAKDKDYPSHLTFDDPYPKNQDPKNQAFGQGQAESNYQIAAGDSLWGIATRNLQKGASAADILGEVNSIARENNISNPDLIYAGQSIRLPGHPSGDGQPGNNNAPGENRVPGNNAPGGNPGNATDTGNMQGNNQVIMNYFMGKGLSREQAAGIAGNLDVESYANPDMHQFGGGPGYGLAQWEDGGRLQDLQNFAAQNGKPASDMGLQLDFIWHELNTTESASLASLREAGSASQAAYSFEQNYERAGVPNLADRENYAQQAFDQYRPA